MRELNMKEMMAVSGGEDDPLVLPPVTVTGIRPSSGGGGGFGGFSFGFSDPYGAGGTIASQFDNYLLNAHVSEEDIWEEHGHRPGGEIPEEQQEDYSPEAVGTDGPYISHGTLHCPSDVPEFVGAAGLLFGALPFPGPVIGTALGALALALPSHNHCTGSSDFTLS